jgi:hypothetical protein
MGAVLMKQTTKPVGIAICVVALSAVTFAVGADASMIDLTLEESACVADPDDAGDWRVLLRFEVPDVLEGGTVDLAVLRVVMPIDCDEEREISVEAFPVTCAWSAEGVVWGVGWQSGEGVWDERRGSISTVVGGEGSVMAIDATHIVGKWFQGNEAAQGLVLAPFARGAFAALAAPPSEVALRVWYTSARQHQCGSEGH